MTAARQQAPWTPLAVTPWDYVWQRYVKAPGEPWR
jgi:hypothetical protein